MADSHSSSSRYFSRNAFERLMLLIATLVKYPGVGHLAKEGNPDGVVDISPTESVRAPFEQHSDQNVPHERIATNHHSALDELHQYVLATATEHNIVLDKCKPATLHRDLKTLREYGILKPGMYRWGYFLGTGALNEIDLARIMPLLHSQSRYQRDVTIKRIYDRLTRRTRNLDDSETLFYPLRAQWNRSIVETDPVERMGRGTGPRSLFDCLDEVEKAILNGQALRLCRRANPYGDMVPSQFKAWPLQLLHYDIAWYLIYQDCQDEHLAVARIDRLAEDYSEVPGLTRTLTNQRFALDQAHYLLGNGWGLFLGQPDAQRLELQGRLPLVEVRVRFYPKVMGFIAEGALRHLSQRLEPSSKDVETGKISYIDYVVKLPERSLQEFSFWVYRFLGHAQVISPESLVEQHHQAAQQQATRYNEPLAQ